MGAATGFVAAGAGLLHNMAQLVALARHFAAGSMSVKLGLSAGVVVFTLLFGLTAFLSLGGHHEVLTRCAQRHQWKYFLVGILHGMSLSAIFAVAAGIELNWQSLNPFFNILRN